MMSEECERNDHVFCENPCECHCHAPSPETIAIMEIGGVEYAMPEEWTQPLASLYGLIPRSPTRSDLLPYGPPDGGPLEMQYFPYGTAPPELVLLPGRLGGQKQEKKPSLDGDTIGKYLLKKMKGGEVSMLELEDWVQEVGLTRAEVPWIVDALQKHGDIYEVSKGRFKPIQ